MRISPLKFRTFGAGWDISQRVHVSRFEDVEITPPPATPSSPQRSKRNLLISFIQMTILIWFFYLLQKINSLLVDYLSCFWPKGKHLRIFFEFINLKVKSKIANIFLNNNGICLTNTSLESTIKGRVPKKKKKGKFPLLGPDPPPLKVEKIK